MFCLIRIVNIIANQDILIYIIELKNKQNFGQKVEIDQSEGKRQNGKKKKWEKRSYLVRDQNSNAH